MDTALITRTEMLRAFTADEGLHPTAGAKSLPVVLQDADSGLDRTMMLSLGYSAAERREAVMRNPEALFRLAESGWEPMNIARAMGFMTTQSFRKWLSDNSMLDDFQTAHADSADLWASVAAHAFDRAHDDANRISHHAVNATLAHLDRLAQAADDEDEQAAIIEANRAYRLSIDSSVSVAAKALETTLKVATKVHEAALKTAAFRNRARYGGVVDNVAQVQPANVSISLDFGASFGANGVREVNGRPNLPEGLDLG